MSRRHTDRAALPGRPPRLQAHNRALGGNDIVPPDDCHLWGKDATRFGAHQIPGAQPLPPDRLAEVGLGLIMLPSVPTSPMRTWSSGW